LGHHLMEDLDLHVLELREIARNLDPHGIGGQVAARVHAAGELPSRSKKPPQVSTAALFAAQLVDRAHKARSQPKNLRGLAKMLEPVAADGQRRKLWEIIATVT